MPKKEELRKVKISKYQDGSGPYDTNGYFHEFAKISVFYESAGTLQETTAIIELENGQVKNIDPTRLKFVDEF